MPTTLSDGLVWSYCPRLFRGHPLDNGDLRHRNPLSYKLDARLNKNRRIEKEYQYAVF